MKTRNIFLLALTAILGVSCHSWDEPSADAGMESFGNKYIQATNVKTIAEVKSLFQSEINNNGLKEVTQSMQIQGIIVGDDAGSNLYKQLYIQDATGALCLSIDQSGLYTCAGVGQCIMVELQGLYIGGYNKQGQVGVSYTKPNQEGATPQIGRMSRYVWQEHFKLIPSIDGLSTKPLSLRNMESLDLTTDCGKLVKLVGIKIDGADGEKTFAPSSEADKGGGVSRNIEGMSNVVIRTSTYAKFAAMVMPTEKINITGIASRYKDTWQIMIRTTDDIEKTTGDEKTDDDVPEVDPAGAGTAADPYNVAAALAQAATLPEISKATDANPDNSMVDVVVKGYVKSPSIDTSYGNATYYISEDGTTTSEQFEIYRGYYTNGDKFTSADQLKVGQKVTVLGTLVNYMGNTPEMTQGSKIVSIDGSGSTPDTPDTPGTNEGVTISGTTVTLTNSSVTAGTETATIDLNALGLTGGDKVSGPYSLSDGSTISVAQGEGKSAPIYHSATKGFRIYASNTITFNASKPIAKIVFSCDSYNGTDYVGNASQTITFSGNTATYCNYIEGNSGGTQLRVKTITVTYAK